MIQNVISSPGTVEKQQAEDALLGLAASGDTERFQEFFFHLRKAAPVQSMRACMRYVAEHGADDVAKTQMLPWLALKNYFDALLDPEFLPLDTARKVAVLMRAEDPQFFLHVNELNTEGGTKHDRTVLRRALSVLDGLPEAGALQSWLRALTASSDERIRSQAVKVTCKMQGNPALINRQLQSEDDRVRANAVEALWGNDSEEAKAIFARALEDVHHRVVMNALIGLHYQHDESAFQKILDYTLNPFETYRAAAIWAIGHVGDIRAIPALKGLIESETSVRVRAKAQRLLAELSVKAEQNAPAHAA